MRTVTISYQVYQFDELEELPRAKAINDQIQFFLETYDEEEVNHHKIKEAIDKAESMLTPWFASSYIWEYAHEVVIDSCREFEYLANGDVFIGNQEND